MYVCVSYSTNLNVKVEFAHGQSNVTRIDTSCTFRLPYMAEWQSHGWAQHSSECSNANCCVISGAHQLLSLLPPSLGFHIIPPFVSSPDGTDCVACGGSCQQNKTLRIHVCTKQDDALAAPQSQHERGDDLSYGRHRAARSVVSLHGVTVLLLQD